MASFCTILVANRGEIACRILRTARNMGYRTAAICSQADTDALHVRLADTAACIGPPNAQASYLNIAAIIVAARQMEADAVHPGYGFLSENAEFARACDDAGLVFIGPSAAAIAAMGNKAAAKRRMIQAGVRCLPGYHEADQSDAALIREAERIGFPLMVKAAAGGGGRGMRLVADGDGLASALAGARAEAKSAFGSGELILEKAIAGGRHVEIQILADAHGNVIHLGERDCSVQRRHQKVLEEAPSPAVDAELRARMGAAAVAAARAIDYTNAGTVEFLLASDGSFYFLEMNTRLQVEHPVTECISGLDLVETQIRLARGEALPLRQEDVALDGHAIEARLYAEAPHMGFMPQPGELTLWRPPCGAGVRVDHGLNSRQTVSPYYDPLLAKIIAHGDTRENARRRLIQALDDTIAFGVPTNRAFLIDALSHREFVAGNATTEFIAGNFARVDVRTPDDIALGLAAVLWFEASARSYGHDPTQAWSSSGALAWPVRLDTGGKIIACVVAVVAARRYSVKIEAGAVEICIVDDCDGTLRCQANEQERRANYAFAGDTLYLKCGFSDFAVRETLYEPAARSVLAQANEAEIRAPMNGRVAAVLVKEGDRVVTGQRLAVVEAMKMQHELVAAAEGTVTSLAVKPGDQVAARQVMIEIKAAV